MNPHDATAAVFPMHPRRMDGWNGGSVSGDVGEFGSRQPVVLTARDIQSEIAIRDEPPIPERYRHFDDGTELD